MEANGGLYVPPDIVRERFVFFVSDSIDFQENTAYGKSTLHGTSMAIHQRWDIQE